MAVIKTFSDIPDDYDRKGFYHKCLAHGDANLVPIIPCIPRFDLRFDDCHIEFCADIMREFSVSYLLSASALCDDFFESIRCEGSLYLFNPGLLIPCAYMCRHAVELKLKELLIRKKQFADDSLIYGHFLKKLWNKLVDSDMRQLVWYSDAEALVDEFELLDVDGMHLRYGYDKDGNFYKNDSYVFHIRNMVTDTKWFFNVLDSYKFEFHSAVVDET